MIRIIVLVAILVIHTLSAIILCKIIKMCISDRDWVAVFIMGMPLILIILLVALSLTGIAGYFSVITI